MSSLDDKRRTPHAPTPETHPRLIYRKDGLRWRGKLKIPRHAHPFVRDLSRAANKADMTLAEISAEAGLSRGQISGWGQRYSPRVADLDAALNVLGLRLVIEPLGDDA
jgi:hypothetical protein